MLLPYEHYKHSVSKVNLSEYIGKSLHRSVYNHIVISTKKKHIINN